MKSSLKWGINNNFFIIGALPSKHHHTLNKLSAFFDFSDNEIIESQVEDIWFIIFSRYIYIIFDENSWIIHGSEDYCATKFIFQVFSIFLNM